MFGFLKSLFAPPSQQAIKDATGRKLYNVERRRRMRTIPNNGGGRVILNNLKKESNKMTERRLDELLKKNNLSTSARPRFRVNKNEKTKSVTFIVPFSTLNKLTSARLYLNSMKRDPSNEKRNRGQFKNIDIINVNKYKNNESTLTFTLSSSKNMTIPIPEHFVEKIYGVDVDLFKKSKIKKEDVINWSKYRRVGKKIKYVKHLVDVSELFETNPLLQKLYGPSGPWETYGGRVASKVEEMRRVVDPKNFVKFLGTTSQQSNALGAQLFEAMKTYIDLEERVFKTKTRIDVQPLYRDYIAKQEHQQNLILATQHDPTFCNIPSHWREHFIKATMSNEQLFQFFHTIGSIRYPHSDVPCPLTKRNDVWKYELNKKRIVNTQINSNDSWLNLLYEREGYVETLKKAHEYIEFCLKELVKYYKMKVSLERRKNAKNGENKSLDIELAWELYSICEKSKLHENPMFRVCAGFRVLNSPNPQDSKFMDRFRYMVHNRPQKTKRSELPLLEANYFSNLPIVEYILTQDDVKYFFMSSDLYNSSKYIINKVDNNKRDVTFLYKNSNCSPKYGGMSLLEQGGKQSKQNKSGNLFLAWPTLHDASVYYKS